MAKLSPRYIAVVLATYCLFFFLLLKTGMIRKFVHPRMTFLIVPALLILLAMFFHNFKKIPSPGRNQTACTQNQCCGPAEKSFSMSNLLLFLPVFLAIMFPPGNIGYRTQTVNDNSTAPPGINRAETVPTMTDIREGYQEFTQLEIGNILFKVSKVPKEHLLHAKISLQGRVLKSPKLKTDEIIVYRFIITCCVADGLPLGIVVKLPPGADFKDGEWIGVSGKIEFKPIYEELKTIEPVAYMIPPEKIYPYFSAEKAYRLNAPPDEYLFP